MPKLKRKAQRLYKRTKYRIERGFRSVSRTSDAIVDLGVSIGALIPAILMVTGIKSIPNLIVGSLSSMLIAYFWVLLMLLGGILVLVSVLTKGKFPTIAWFGKYAGLPAIACGISIYAISAAYTFGIITGIVTVGICWIAVLYLLKDRRRSGRHLVVASAKYDAKKSREVRSGDEQ